jgi:hypothetical protein
MVLRASHGLGSPNRPNRVPRVSHVPRMTRPHERTQGHRGRFVAPARQVPLGVRGRVRPVVHSRRRHIVREPIPVHVARRSRRALSASQAGTGGHRLVVITAVGGPRQPR